MSNAKSFCVLFRTVSTRNNKCSIMQSMTEGDKRKKTNKKTKTNKKVIDTKIYIAQYTIKTKIKFFG